MKRSNWRTRNYDKMISEDREIDRQRKENEVHTVDTPVRTCEQNNKNHDNLTEEINSKEMYYAVLRIGNIELPKHIMLPAGVKLPDHVIGVIPVFDSLKAAEEDARGKYQIIPISVLKKETP